LEPNGLELEDHIIRFFFDNIYKKPINYWKKQLVSLDRDKLLNLRNEFEVYLDELPSVSEIELYSTIHKYQIKNWNGEVYVPRGDQAIITSSLKIGKELIDLIDERLIINNEELIKEFPNYGKWNNSDNPSHFLLNRNTLGCVALAFEKVKVSQALQLENIYVRLSNILYQFNGKPYSYISFRNAKQNSKKTAAQCRKEVPFLVGESVEFVTYLLKMEEKFDSVKKNEHQS